MSKPRGAEAHLQVVTQLLCPWLADEGDRKSVERLNTGQHLDEFID